MAEATAYSCPSCNAALKLDPTSGRLVCNHCMSSFTVEEVEAHMDVSTPAGDAAIAIESYTIEDWDRMLSDGTHEQLDNVVCYVCENCGAEVVTDRITVATSCQYCGSSVVVSQRLRGTLKPSCVLPFRIKAEELPGRLTSFYKDRPLLPKNFFYENQIGQVQGIYVPFWLFSGTVDGDATYQTSSANSYMLGNFNVTETTRYSSDRRGIVDFKSVPVDASERIDNDLMDSIEPFDFRGLQPFRPGYLTGFVAERFDQSPRDNFERASQRMEHAARDLFTQSVPGAIEDAQETFDFVEARAAYAMLPVYLFNCSYEGKLYRYAVNGQTGKIVGEVPIGRREITRSFLRHTGKAAVLIGIVAIILGAVMLF